MSCSKIDPALHQAKKPDWIKVRLPTNPVFFSTKALISDLRLHTVCEEAQCPNRWECWSAGDGDVYDRRRALHAGLWVLRGDDGEAFCAGSR